MSSSNCCFLICIQVSQEAGKVVWYFHFFKNFPQFVVIHTETTFRIKPLTCQRHSEGTNKALCTPGPRDPSGHWARPVFECLLWRDGSAVACCGDRGSGCSRPGRPGVWHKSSWRKSPLAPPYSLPADDPQTGEQLHQRSSHTIVKVLGPKTDFPTWRSSKGTENPQGIWLWRPVRADYRISTGLGKQTPWGHKWNIVHTRTQEKGEVTPKEAETDFPASVQKSLAKVWVNIGLP